MSSRRRRFCRNCGAVVVADPEDVCPGCGRTGFAGDDEPWRRIRARDRAGDSS